MRGDLPSGDVTLLFTDIEGSTKLLHDLGAERYASALRDHRQVVRDACTGQGGVEVDTQGDAFFFAFTSAPGALRAARAIAHGLETGRVRVRVGIHSGSPLLTDEGYVGPDVHRAARIAAAGHGGQILVSATTVRLAEAQESQPPDVLRDLGEHRFKDLAAAERVFQLGVGDFPPIRTLYRTNLPVPATAFVGREAELEQVAQLLCRDDIPLLTLTGPGGTGKTRLALQAAAEATEAYPDGLWWVSLAPLREAHVLVSSLAQALWVEEQPGRELAEVLAARLEGMRALLVLDNAEHLLPSVGDHIARLRDIPGPTLLVTSRERLQLQGEHVYEVPPLAETDAVALFMTRARALRADAQESAAVTELCSRLDNLPLALELAAARTVVFSPEQLLERLAQRLDLLKVERDADPRQQTLRATIEWSYELLDENERRLFRALAVFSGGCTYEAAEEVCDADPDGLQSLLDKSLLRRLDRAGAPRYWMLETIRELASEKLAEHGEMARLRRLHAEHCLALARSSNLDAEAEGPQRHDIVLPERDNMRAALAWALEAGERELGLELLVGLENFWATNSPHEGIEWASALLESASDVSPRLVGRALRVHGGMENASGRPDVAEELWGRALAIARASGDQRAIAVLLHRFSHVAIARRDFPRVRALAEESLAGHRAAGFAKGEAQALSSLAVAARAEGDLAGALELLQESARIAQSIGFRWWHAGALANIGLVLLELGRLPAARESVRQALTLSRAMHDRRAIVFELRLLSEISARSGDIEYAGALSGAAEAEDERLPVGRWVHAVMEPKRLEVGADQEFESGRSVGRTLTLEDAVDFALEGQLEHQVLSVT